MTRLEELAAQVAMVAPPAPRDYQQQVYVPTWLLREIRGELERTGFDWRLAQKRMKELERKREPGR